MHEPPLTWEAFASQLHEVTGLAVERLTPEARLVEDLGLDSLELVELFLVATDGRDSHDAFTSLEERRWEGVTARELHELSGRATPQGR
jgi:hypothetical protein